MIIIFNPVDTLGFGERGEEREKKRRCCGGAPPLLGVLCFCWAVREFGSAVVGTAPGGRIKWGGESTSLNPTFYPRPSPRWAKPSTPRETALFASGGRAGARKTEGLGPLSDWCFVSRRYSVFVVRLAPTKPLPLCSLSLKP